MGGRTGCSGTGLARPSARAPGMRIIADRLTVEGHGKRLVFENNVNVMIEPTAITARALAWPTCRRGSSAGDFPSD